MEISDKELNRIEKMLNTTISNLLFGPSCDPDWDHCAGAAVSFKILKMLNLKVKAEDEVKKILETDNVWNENFLKQWK